MMSTFITFPVASTNIFPLSNSKAGGQLATEFNLRSIDTVGTPSVIEYHVGPSYVHSLTDYEVSVLRDNVGSIVSASTLQISPGRGVINGHFVETFAPMVIDLLEENNRLSKKKGAKPLKGKLAIGIKAVYSTEVTMAGAMKVENASSMYEGLEIVILPEEELLLPIDVPEKDRRNQIKAHLKLATFTFYDGVIQNISNNTDKCKYIDAERIHNMKGMLDGTYISKNMLNPRKLYTFAGKGTDPTTGNDTWCDSLDSLMVWDNKPGQATTEKPVYDEATFVADQDKVSLIVPHKQVDGMVNALGQTEYYPPRTIQLPTANYGTNTPGTVDSKYTQNIKNIAKRLSEFHQLIKGKQVHYIDIKTQDVKLPPINPSWAVGDYVLVGQDYTAEVTSDSVRPPATVYAVLPGIVTEIEYVGSNTTLTPPASLKGAQLLEMTSSSEKDGAPDSSGKVGGQLPVFFTDEDEILGVKNEDYFVLTYYTSDNFDTFTRYYYKVKDSKPRSWSNFILLTGEIPLAQESVIGGFYNVPVNTSATSDAGYVYLDETGHLRLLDYGLLRSGTLAYQLGEDIELPKGLTLDELQNHLDEFVNERIAFPADKHRLESSTPNLINIYLDISKDDEGGDLYIRNIDSRFGAAVYLHISGDASDNVTVHISDCERFRISSNLLYGGPKISLYRTAIYYDAAVLNYIHTSHLTDGLNGMTDIKLWYERFEDSDANLVVDGMTVSEMDAPIISNDVEFWNNSSANDNHYFYALKSITFSGEGEIVSCQMLVANDSTQNVDPGHKLIMSKFKLPQGYGLLYPDTCLTKPLKITGSFVSAYLSGTPSDGWVITDTNFTALTGVYDAFAQGESIEGTIAFHSNTNVIEADLGVETIPGWQSDSYHIFSGGVIS